jgi:DNA-binding XRE family transcriptional regulator
MLERWIEPAVRYMRPEFTTHDYIEKLREVYPADYAHDLALCTLEQGFPQSLAVLHRAIIGKLRKSDRVMVIGTKESRDIRGNTHETLLWRRLDARRPPPKPQRGPTPSRRKASQRPRPPAMTGSELREARLALGWTKTDLARRAGVSLAAVSRWEAGERRMQWPASEAVQNALQATRSGSKAKGAPAARQSAERA